MQISAQTVQAENPKRIESNEENSAFMNHSSQNSDLLQSRYVADEVYLTDGFQPLFKVEVKGCTFKQDNLIAIGHWEFHLLTSFDNTLQQVERRYSDF